MDDINSIDTQAQSVTATICEQAHVYGATPERGEFDPRAVWDEDDAMEAVSEAFRIVAEGIGPDGTQLADERESLLWGFVNTLDAQVRRLDRSVDRLVPGMREMQQGQDGSEVKARELELLTDRARNLGDRRDAFEKMRDTVADAVPSETGEVWRPRRGSHVSQDRTTSPPPPSTPATSSEPARTARRKLTCPREPSSPSPAARTSATPPSSPRTSTRPGPSTPTWC